MVLLQPSGFFRSSRISCKAKVILPTCPPSLPRAVLVHVVLMRNNSNCRLSLALRWPLRAGKTNEMSHGSTKGDIKYVLMTMLQQRVGQELGSEAEEQAKRSSLKKVNVLASSTAPILPEDWQQLFEKYQSRLTEQVYCVKHVELVRNPKFAPSHDKDAALWNAFVEFYRSKQCPLETCFQSCLSASCEMQNSPGSVQLVQLVFILLDLFAFSWICTTCTTVHRHQACDDQGLGIRRSGVLLSHARVNGVPPLYRE